MSNTFDFSANFVYTGSTQVWSKPQNVSSIICQVKGGGGGGSSVASGGGGAYIFTQYNFLNKDISYNVFINVGSGGKAPPIQTGGKSTGGVGNLINGGDGSTINNLSSGGGGGMTSIFYQDGAGNNTIQIIAGGGGGGGGENGNGGIGGEIGGNGGGTDGGGQGGNKEKKGYGGLGGENGGVNGFNYINSSNNNPVDISNNGIYAFEGGGGGNGGTFTGGGGGAGYGGGAGGKGGGGGGGGSLSNGETIYYLSGQGGAGGSLNTAGQNGNVTIGWFELLNNPSIVEMFMLNSQHTARSIYTGPSILPLSENITSTQTTSSSYSSDNSIVINNDEEVYFISVDGYLYKYDYTNNFGWRFRPDNYKFIGTPIANNSGTVYACSTTTSGNGTSYLYAIIEENIVLTNNIVGKTKWNFALDGNCVGSPISDASGNIYIGTTNGSIYKIADDLIFGREVWKYASPVSGTQITGTLAIDKNEERLIYTGYNNTIDSTTRYIYSIDISTNPLSPTSAWSFSLNNTDPQPRPLFNSPSINDDGYIYVTDLCGNVYGFNNIGTKLFERYLNNMYRISNVAIGNNNYIYCNTANVFYKINSTTGNIEWIYNHPPLDDDIIYTSSEMSFTPTIDANNNIYFGTSSNRIICINPITRTHLWSYELDGTLLSMPVISFNTDIKFITNNGNLYSIQGNGTPIVPVIPDVSMFMLDERHTGKSTYNAPSSKPSIKWTSNVNILSANLYILPTIAINSTGENLYLGSFDGVLYSLYTEDGTLDWSANLVTANSLQDNDTTINDQYALYTSPLISFIDGTIYMLSNNAFVYAVDSSGNIKWNIELTSPIKSSPVMDSSGNLYIGSNNYIISIGDAGTHPYLKWLPVYTGGTISSSPALGQNGTLYVGSTDGYVYGVNKTTGEEIWKFNTNILILASPSIDASNNIIIGNGSLTDGELYYLDGSNNAMSDADRKIWSLASVANELDVNIGPFYNTVAINDSTNRIYLSTIAYVYAIDRITGLKVWTYRKSHCYYTSPVIDANGKILFCSIGANNSYPYLHMVTDKNINALKNIDNYTEDWKLQISQTANERLSPPVIGRDNTIYINSTANKIYAINIPTSP